MIELIKFNNKFAFSLNNINKDKLFRFLYFLNILKKEEFIPNYKYDNFKNILIINSHCRILEIKNISGNIFRKKINYIINKLDSLKIRLNKLELIPLLENNNNKIYFLNFFNSINSSIKKKYNLTKYSNYYTNNYLFFKYLKKNYNFKKLNNNNKFYILLYNLDLDYSEFLNILKEINQISLLGLDIRFILLVKEEFYIKINLILNKDLINKFFILKINNDFNLKNIFNILLLLKEYTLDYLIITKSISLVRDMFSQINYNQNYILTKNKNQLILSSENILWIKKYFNEINISKDFIGNFIEITDFKLTIINEKNLKEIINLIKSSNITEMDLSEEELKIIQGLIFYKLNIKLKII